MGSNRRLIIYEYDIGNFRMAERTIQDGRHGPSPTCYDTVRIFAVLLSSSNFV